MRFSLDTPISEVVSELFSLFGGFGSNEEDVVGALPVWVLW